MAVFKFASFLLLFLASKASPILGLNDSKDLLLDSDEKFALDKFKLQVADLMPEKWMKSEFYLIRWLRATDLDIPQAQKKLLNNVKWRRENNISTILNEDFSDMKEEYPISFDGHDKDGRPIMEFDLSSWDIRTAALQGRLKRVQRYLTYAAEKSMRNILEAQKKHNGGKPVTRQIVLMDVDGLNLIQHGCVQCISVISTWAMIGDTYYPRNNDQIILVNAPQFAVITLNTIRGLLSAESRNTLKVFNSNRRVWMQYLDERIDRSQRSKRYGGTLDI